MDKSENNNFMIVLGNGATMGARRYPIESSWKESMSKMPSASNFFYDLFQQRGTTTRSKRFLNSLGMTYEGTNRFLVYAWGLKNNIESFEPDEWKNVNIEEVFTFLDVGERMFPGNDKHHATFQKAKRYLIDFISTMLIIRCEGQHCEHLLSLFSSLKPRDTIISFNWDTIADTTLAKLGKSQFRNYYRLMNETHINLEHYKRRGLFLKLHGSFNWVVCHNKDCKNFEKPALAPLADDKTFPRFTSKNLHKCQACKQKNADICIIPPVSNKLIYRDDFIRKLWLLARERLAYTNRIAFLGYSFPHTDFYAEWLFRTVNLFKDANFEIDVVNPEIFKKESHVYKRYNSIFKNFKLNKYRSLAEYENKFYEISKGR